jgi:hypothetical protein
MRQLGIVGVFEEELVQPGDLKLDQGMRPPQHHCLARGLDQWPRLELGGDHVVAPRSTRRQ